MTPHREVYSADIERENLEVHVEMALERHKHLHQKVDAMAQDLKLMREDHIKELKEMREEASKESRALKTAVITSSATVIVGLLGLLSMIVTKLGPALSKLGLL